MQMLKNTQEIVWAQNWTQATAAFQNMGGLHNQVS